MKRFLFAAGAVAVALLATTDNVARASFHVWRFTEFFSSPDGSVQFIEMRATSNFEHVAEGAEIRSLSTGKVFTFLSNLSSTATANKNLLIATENFAALPGAVTPDFTLPSSNFFDPAGDTITLVQEIPFGTIDTKIFDSVPTDGILSRNYHPVVGLATNTPRNFAGAQGSVNLSAPSPTGDYNGNGNVDAADYVLWRDTLNEVVTAGQGADGDADGTIDDGDYDFWRARFGNTVPGTGLGAGSTAVPEPTAAIVISAALGLPALARRR